MIDNRSRESPLLEVGLRLTGESVALALTGAARAMPLPTSITVDHGTEFTSWALDQWAWENKVQPHFTQPGKPTDNGPGESFNGQLRHECLNAYAFESFPHTQRQIEAWCRDYNEHCPHGSLCYRTPSESFRSSKISLPEAA